MLPTPSTSHVSFDRIYEPAEDSYLLLDTLSSPSETSFLQHRFSARTQCGSPLILEVGVGSGVVLAFTAANAQTILGRSDVLSLGIDINSFACHAAAETVRTAIAEKKEEERTVFLDTINTSLTAAVRPSSVDILIFNPPYVPTEELPDDAKHAYYNGQDSSGKVDAFQRDSHLLALSYAGGTDGMEVTNRLLAELPHVLHKERGVAYVLLCAQNKPETVKQKIQSWGPEWQVMTAGYSGKKGGWEKLQILRIWRDSAG